MKPDFAQLGFIIKETSDGSPTLRFSEEEELMHHSGGAATETNYIYTSVIRSALAFMPQASTCVVGLGLAYIEIAWALCRPVAGVKLISYEIVPVLSENFIAWVLGAEDKLYDQITGYLEPGSSLGDVKARLAENLSTSEIRRDIREGAREPWNIICFDAFSRKSATDLWGEKFLLEFISSACAEDCVFTTYGCTGVLKRCLKSHGFKMIPRKSFNGKRDSTLAVRGRFISDSVFQIF